MNRNPYIPLFGLTLLLALAWTSGLGAQSILQPSDVVNLPLVSAPTLSPDGSQVVYVQKIPRSSDEDRGADYSMLWVVSSDGGSPNSSARSRTQVSY